MTESDHQILVVTWCRKMALAGRPELSHIFHTANGGLRSKREASMFKLMGVVAGVSDLFLPVMSGGKGGLWIELKEPGKGKVSTEQKEWLSAMQEAGYAASVAYGWEEAVEAIKSYLAQLYPESDWPNIDMGKTANEMMEKAA